MKNATFAIALLTLLTCMPAWGQDAQPVKEDFKPSELNQPGQKYPQVNSQRYARFRVVAPTAQSVKVSLARGATQFGRNPVTCPRGYPSSRASSSCTRACTPGTSPYRVAAFC